MRAEEVEVGGHYKIFNNNAATDLARIDGLAVVVKKAYTEPDENHDAEALPMFLVEVTDRSSADWLSDIEVWADELEALDAADS